MPPRGVFALIVLVAGVLALAAGGGFWYLQSHASCTVGLAGTDMQAEAVGPHSHQFCQFFLDTVGSAGYQIEKADPSGTFMCVVELHDGTVVTVRDKGALKIYGSAECQVLNALKPLDGYPTPEPSQ